MGLHKELLASENYRENYYEALATLLIMKKGTAKYPTDEEFQYYFTNKDIYKFKNKNYFLYSLESFQNKELVPFADLTIEHIMPQTLTTKWNIELGDKSKEVHEKYLHNIGNLTLSAYNSELSNKSFKEKKELLQTSGIQLNKYFQNINHWNKEEIEKRAKFLYENVAIKIWKYPKIDRKLLKKEESKDFFTLADNFDITGTKPKKIEIEDKLIVLKKRSWIECFMEFNNYLYRKDALLFETFLSDDDFQGRETRIIANKEDLCRKARKLNDLSNIYIESNLSATSIVKYIKLIAEKYELVSDNVLLYLH